MRGAILPTIPLSRAHVHAFFSPFQRRHVIEWPMPGVSGAVFDEAQAHIYALMKAHSFKRFLKSKQYAQLEKEIQAGASPFIYIFLSIIDSVRIDRHPSPPQIPLLIKPPILTMSVSTFSTMSTRTRRPSWRAAAPRATRRWQCASAL